MKMYKKSDLTLLSNGYLVNGDGDVVVVDPAIVAMANTLETEVQKAEWRKGNAVAPVEIEKFVRKSVDDEVVEDFKCETPLLDKRAEEAMALMDEIDTVSTVEKLNQVQKLYIPLFKFVAEDMVMCIDGQAPVPFDTPVTGNPLEWTKDDVQDMIAKACDLEIETTVELGIAAE